MVILLQDIASSDANITQRLIVYRLTEIYGSYIEYLPLTQVVTVLEYPENQNRRS